MSNTRAKLINQELGVTAPGILEALIKKAQYAGVSDIHLQLGSGGAAVAFRLDGVLTPADVIPSDLADRVFGRIKFLARLKTYQDSLPQDGRIEKVAVNSISDIRVATYPTVTGEKIVLRLFNTSSVKPIAELGFPADVRTGVIQFLKQSSGLLLITGPSGSGKTTTIYACLHDLASQGGRHIITIEDPVEQIIPGIMQTEISEVRGLDFSKAARHLLRQDPQVLVFGEIRDEETANIAVRAALTGHMVIATLHAGSCAGVFERLTVLCRDHSAVASSVELVLNQRLVRGLCQHCSGQGCEACLQTGYRGRFPLVEHFRPDAASRRAIAKADTGSITARSPLQERAKLLISSGITSTQEIERVLGFPS
jgi:type II secretory ATPase GspE/PulE/Tfp pilus assembly ATPase PilB-like protein